MLLCRRYRLSCLQRIRLDKHEPLSIYPPYYTSGVRGNDIRLPSVCGRELKEARVLIEMWRKEYNTIRPHSALGYRLLVPETIMVPTTQFHQLALT